MTDYKASKRIVGTSAERLATVEETATWSTDFSSATGWSEETSSGYEDNMEIQTANNRMWYDFDTSSSKKIMNRYDLNSNDSITTSNTSWVLRFKIISTVKSSAGAIFIGLSDNGEDTSNQQKFLGFWWKDDGSTSWRATTDNDNNSGGLCATNLTTAVSYTPTTDKDYFVTVIRDGSNLKLSVREDSHTGTLLGSEVTQSITTTTTGLNTLKVINHRCGSSGQIKGYVYDMKFYNGMTSTTKTANIQTNSIWEESDTGKHYIWSGSAWVEVA